MNKRQKEVLQSQLNNEKAVLKKLEANYQDALDEINSKIELLMARQDADMQHVIYQVEYQKALKTQVQAILENLQTNEFETVSEYLAHSYEDGFIGTMYDLQGQGIPLIFPIDQEQVVQAIQTETKLSESLYASMGHDIKDLQKKIAGEISRGLASGQMYSEITRNIAGWAKIPKNRAMTIARTESHRIQTKASYNAQHKAKDKGADVVKQWDSTLDGKTRDSHRQIDGEIRELDEPFSNGLMYPGDPSGSAAEVVNCRCALLQRARWALGNDYTKWSADAPVVVDDDGTTQFAIIEADSLKDFSKKYKQASERVREGAQKMNDDVVQRLKDKGIVVDVEQAGQYREEAYKNLKYLDKLTDDYENTVVSYSVKKTKFSTEGGQAYMLNGRTSISVSPLSYKKNKATDALRLVDNQPFGTTYHEFAHSLSQSREKIDKDFWKEIRKLKKEYELNRGSSKWFDIKISDYASKDIDEFFAEAFTQAKLSDNPSPYSLKVLGVVDKYFKKTPLENIGKSSKIESDIPIHKSVGAKFNNYAVRLPDGSEVSFTEGTRITNIKTIAGKGRERQIDMVDLLVDEYGGSAEEWQKKKGIGYVDYEGESYKTEVHWYEEPTAGRHDFKVKSYNGEWIIDE